VGVKSLLQTLSQDRVSQEQIPHLLILALKNMDRLEHLVENVLISGRLRVQGHPLQPSPLELGPFLVGFVQHRRELLSGQPEALVLEGEEVTLRVLAESDALRVILENLVDNALKYGGDERITVRVKQEGNYVGIAVADRGIGFQPDEAELLFTPFFRALSGKQSIKHGTGLGLHISRSLARQMGGDLKAFSRGLGEGSCFTLTLRAA
jgi:two-component system, OmpR family, sensor histidine kinase SenX3